MSKPYVIRPICYTDIPDILAIQSCCYAEHLIESAQALEAKCRVAPQSCWLVEEMGEVLAYLFSHPWHEQSLPEWNHPLESLPVQSSVFFLHDLAIRPKARGRGLAQALIYHAFSWAKQNHFEHAMLVSVQESQAFWQGFGFHAPTNLPVPIQKKLQSYGMDAACLIANIL